MRRNPLLYSDAGEADEAPDSTTPKQKGGAPRESSFLFYFIILANSLLVLFVLGFIWFLFLKSPDLQIKEISNRMFGTAAPTEQATQPVIAPKVEAEVVITPSQQEKDEIQQAQLKQMREKEELAAERVRLEAMKVEIEKEKLRASEAQQVIVDLKKQEESATVESKTPTVSPTTEIDPAETISTTDQIIPEEPGEQEIIPNADKEPVLNSNTTSSQVDLIMETLKNQQQQKTNDQN